MIPGGERHNPAPHGGARPVVRRQAQHGKAVLLALTALVCGAAGLALAANHPVAPRALLAAVAALVALSVARPDGWLVWLPALLPLTGLAPWTGWICFEEWDLLVLAAAAGGYARWAGQTWARQPADLRGPSAPAATALVGLVVALWVAAQWLAMARGVTDAGGFSFGWFQGYRESMNSLRLAKPMVGALLLWPLWALAQRQDPQRSARHLALGMTLGLLGVCLATVWERAAFTGLLNFSTDYRTTGLFWEMHVGGAALDGFLALAVPFAVRELLVAPSRGRWLALAAVTALAWYSCLTTFSRIVYLAVPAGLAVMAWVHLRQGAAARRQSGRHWLTSAAPAGLLVAVFALAAGQIFSSSGYRGLLALLGAFAVLLPLAPALRRCTAAQALLGLIAGLLLTLAGWALAGLHPKGAYIFDALALGLALLMLVLLRRARSPGRYRTALALAGFIAVLGGLGRVALHYNGPAALQSALPVAGGLLVILAAARALPAPPWPAGLRWQGMTFGAMGLAASIVAALSGGAYMTDRFATVNADFDGRMQHWRQSLALLRTADEWLLGKGLGRYVDNYALAATSGQRPGDYRLAADGDNPHLTLVAGTHMIGWGELLRISQRVALPVGPQVMAFDVRAEQAATVHFEVCLKHLLYDGGCLIKQVQVAAKPGQWQHLRTLLDGKPLLPGDWYAPPLVMFSVGIENSAAPVQLDNLLLAGPDGRNLLVNGDFSQGLARWFFSSDRNHLPWHAKNLGVHLVVEQGLLGLVLFSTLFVGALLRVTLGPGRHHPLAPAIAGGLVGLVTVGLFDSLLDMPRLAFLFYFMLLLGLTLRARGASTFARPGAAVAQNPPSDRAVAA